MAYRRPQLVLFAIVLSFSLTAAGAAQSTAPPETELALAGCPEGPFGERHLCGVLSVPENRSVEESREIPIFVATLPARVAATKPPIFLLSGGPSLSAADQMPLLELMFAALNENRDFVTVDLRGTGRSNPLPCAPPGPPERLQSYAVDLWPAAHSSDCRDRLAAKADLRQYTIPASMADLEAVRNALGYDRISLVAISYGTRMAQEYLRHHGARVERTVLFGALPPSVHTPQGFARLAQEALEALFVECATAADCAKSYPNLPSKLAQAIERLERAPQVAQVTNPATGEQERVSIHRGIFGSALRAMLYETDQRRLVPRMIQESAQGDFRLAATLTTWWQSFFYKKFHHGTYYSITCTEDVPFVDLDAELEDAAGTFVGAYRVRNQIESCRGWPRGEVPSDFHQPVRSDVATLLVSGSVDPVTPPAVAEEVARHLSSSAHLVLAHRPHDPSNGWPQCAGPIVGQFLDGAAPDSLDLSCGQRLEPIPFAAPDEELPFN